MVGKILIVDDVATNRIVFKVKLGAACYMPILAADGAGCLRMARQEAPDLILLDLMLPDMSGIDVLRRLRADPMTRDIPVVVFSASTEHEARLEAFRAGADDFLSKPIDDQTLMARLRSLLRAREVLEGAEAQGIAAFGLAEAGSEFEGPGVIALVTDRTETAMRWRKELTAVVSDQIVTLTREEALAENATARGATPDVFVIEADLGGGGGGLRLMSDLRSRGSTRHAAVCIVRPDTARETVAMAFDLGANDLVGAGFHPREMALRLRTLVRRKRLGDRMRASVQDGLRLAVIDPLTGLHNRRFAMPYLAGIAERAQSDQSSFAVMVVDLDRFKAVNDRFGHAAGDAVLVEVARRLMLNLRAGDLLARIGGEEFLVALPDVTFTEAQGAAERLCRAIDATPVAVPGGHSLTVTVSIGLAIGEGHRFAETAAAIMDRADHALLAAKSDGRNKVTISQTAA